MDEVADQLDAAGSLTRTRELPLANRLLSPKRSRVDSTGLESIFPYYAGFSLDWATNQINLAQVPRNAAVLDPWNGSGTTTLAAHELGFSSIGIDLNPVATAVARLRAQFQSETSIREQPASTSEFTISEEDALLHWLSPQAVSRIRQWVHTTSETRPAEETLCLVAVFRALRKVTKVFEGSNPTWVRSVKHPDERISIDNPTLDAMIVEEQRALVSKLRQKPHHDAALLLVNGSSNELPLASNSIDFVLTSPPYLTRIDYAVAYTRELAVLGIDIKANRRLRSDLMGTTLIRRPDTRDITFGPLIKGILKGVSEHQSKDSAGYYFKQANQYFRDLLAGLGELARVAKIGSEMQLVVQDSYYKDIHVPLAEICTQEAEILGWKFVDDNKFRVSRSLASLNTSARAYAKGDVDETVLILERIDNE